MSREQILQRIRTALGRRQPLDPSIVGALEQRTAAHTVLVQPGYDEDLYARLLRKHGELKGTSTRIDAETDIVGAVREYLLSSEVPAKFVMSDLAVFNDLSWGDGVETETRPACSNDRVCLSMASSAIAETGTLALLSSPQTPMSHNYLPEHHIIVVRESTVLRWQEDLWSVLRKSDDFPPRAIALVSGPSKTADVEQTIEYGAHGPKFVHMILLNDG